MAKEHETDRRSLLKRTAVAAAGTGVLIGSTSGSVSATHDYAAANPDEDYVKVRAECDSIPGDLVPNGECGEYLGKCYDDAGNTLLYIDWHGSWRSGWVLERNLSYC